MAVIKTITTERNVVFENQYCRVDKVVTEKEEMQYEIGVYTSQTVAQEGGYPHRAEVFFCSYDLYGDNPWVQAYTDLKTKWPDAVDLL